MNFLQWIQIVYFVARAIVYIMNDQNGLKDTLIDASRHVSDVPSVGVAKSVAAKEQPEG